MSTPAKLADIAEALEMMRDGVQGWLDRQTGNVVLLTEEELLAAEHGDEDRPAWMDDDETPRLILADEDAGGGRFVLLPDAFELDDWSTMAEFARSWEDHERAAALDDAIRGKGAFRRFRDCIHEFGIEQAWYAFQREAYRDVARQWCADHDVEPTDDDAADGDPLPADDGRENPDDDMPDRREVAEQILRIARIDPALREALAERFGIDPEKIGSDDRPPEPGDELAWCLAGLAAVGRATRHLDTPRMQSVDAAVAYFGDDELDYYLHVDRDPAVVVAYCLWGLLDDRSAPAEPAPADGFLSSEDLTEPLRQAWRALMASRPRLYRLKKVDRDGRHVTLKDVFTSRSVTVCDPSLAEPESVGGLVAARVYTVADVTLAAPAGPAVPKALAKTVMSLLEAREIRSADDLDEHPEQLGRLWGWIEMMEGVDETAPLLVNLDGEPFSALQAHFTLTDPSAFRSALAERDDIDVYEAPDEFVWVRRTGHAAEKLGGPVNLVHFRISKGRLRADANSRERMALLRQWLEAIDGVTLDRTEERPPEEYLERYQPELFDGIRGRSHGPWPFGAGADPLDDDPPPAPAKPTRKVGRNEPCPCGSGKKYEKCCGR